jgi:hypothetical protein
MTANVKFIHKEIRYDLLVCMLVQKTKDDT